MSKYNKIKFEENKGVIWNENTCNPCGCKERVAFSNNMINFYNEKHREDMLLFFVYITKIETCFLFFSTIRTIKSKIFLDVCDI